MPSFAFRPRGTFAQNPARSGHSSPCAGSTERGGLCPLPRPARAFTLNHAFCPGYFLPCFSIFALPRRTLKGGPWGTIVGSPCFFRFLSSEKGRIKKANFVLVQTRLETSTLLSTFLKNRLFSKIQKGTDSLPSSSLKNQKSSFLKSLKRNVCPAQLFPKNLKIIFL